MGPSKLLLKSGKRLRFETSGKRILVGLGMLFVFTILTSGQEPAANRIGAPDDWTHHRLIFSDPGTADDAVRKGTYSHWSKIVNDPRYILQREKRNAAATGGLKFDAVLPPGDTRQDAKEDASPRDAVQVELKKLPRGLSRAPLNSPPNVADEGGDHHKAHPPRDEHNSLHKDWSESMGSGAKTGLGMFPAKYSFNINSANCGNAAQPDYVVYNTSLPQPTTQASIIAYDNLYSGCTSGAVPSTYWAYNTGGTVVTSATLSLDGSQVAFVQSSSGGSASLVLLKWKANDGTVATPTNLTSQTTGALYRSCGGSCMFTISFTGAANDTASSVFCDYGSDTIYVGDDSGKLHKFTGVFNGTPAEAPTPWPVTVGASALASPVYDPSSGKVLVGDYLLDSDSTCGPSGEPCGLFHSVNASTGSVTTSHELDYIFGIADSPLVDSTVGEAYVFVGADNSTACGTGVPCSAVFQFPTDFASQSSGAEMTVGPGYQFLLSGTFDNDYFSSTNEASPTGHLYVVGNTGPGNNTLYQISINSNFMSAPSTAGPAVSTNYTEGYESAGLQITEVDTGTKDYIFLSVLTYGAPAGCSGSLSEGCVMGFDVTAASISPATTPTGATPEAGGTSGIIVDNISTLGGASNIYYTPLDDENCATSEETGGCAIQILQSAP